MSERKSFAQNTVILFIAVLISKTVSALFKIPLTNILGGAGMGYYSAAYSLFNPIFAVTAAGIPTVIVKVTARFAGGGRYDDARRTLRVALRTFGLLGLIGTVVLIALAAPFSTFAAQSPESLYAVLAIAPSVFLCCVGSVFKGYYEGLSNMAPTAVSIIVESVSRAAIGLTSSFFIVNYASDCFNAGLPVFGNNVSSIEQAIAAALPFAAAAATLSATIGELCGAAVFALKWRFGKKTADTANKVKGKEKSGIEIAKSLIKDCVPIWIGSVVINLSSFIDLITITRCINYSIGSASEYYQSTFGRIISLHGGDVNFGNFMFGSYTGIAVTMVMLIPAFTGMLSKSALPDIAAAWSIGDFRNFKRKVTLVIRSNLLIGIPLYLGLAAISEPALGLLYASRPEEAAVSVLPMTVLSVGGVFMTLASSFFAIFQVIGRSDLPVRIMLFALGVKLVLNVFLIPIPEINITGAALSSSIAYAAAAFGGYFALENHCKMGFGLLSLTAVPLISGLSCAAAAFFSYNFFVQHFSQTLSLLFGVATGAILYVFLLIIQGGVDLKNLLNRQIFKKSVK
ncbi:MAG: polysaccharide biosynthesis protein [Eubacterium sp.]|nr:polysaccharide biosynthesis protein [Eubacterium sp.]